MIERKRIVVLGTGTGVGKTHVTVALARALRAQGKGVLALKPIESGSSPDSPDSDAARLSEACGHVNAPLYALRAPLSPHLAARLESREIRVSDVVAWVKERETQVDLNHPLPTPNAALEGAVPPFSVTLIETAGGVFSPLSSETSNHDLALALDPSFDPAFSPAWWVLVAPDRLGVLHDVAATLRALSPRRPDVIVINATTDDTHCEMNNLREIEQTVLPQVLGRRIESQGRSPKTESRPPKTESRSPKTENRHPKTENRSPKVVRLGYGEACSEGLLAALFF